MCASDCPSPWMWVTVCRSALVVRHCVCGSAAGFQLVTGVLSLSLTHGLVGFQIQHIQNYWQPLLQNNEEKAAGWEAGVPWSWLFRNNYPHLHCTCQMNSTTISWIFVFIFYCLLLYLCIFNIEFEMLFFCLCYYCCWHYPGPSRRTSHLPRWSSHPLRQFAHHSCHLQHRSWRRVAPHHRRDSALGLPTEIPRERPHAEAPADADGQSGVQSGSGMQGGWARLTEGLNLILAVSNNMKPNVQNLICGCFVRAVCSELLRLMLMLTFVN